ncbi:unnamed protein product [Mesocestoides corti]|uniref:Uncharacterized protein n=1 Tax=Mesocestoides corti TaxID=53468 RepID=A0A0R3U2B2_MESCO|nr:unnamed protein product [Mesocestoides corti]
MAPPAGSNLRIKPQNESFMDFGVHPVGLGEFGWSHLLPPPPAPPSESRACEGGGVSEGSAIGTTDAERAVGYLLTDNARPSPYRSSTPLQQPVAKRALSDLFNERIR